MSNSGDPWGGAEGRKEMDLLSLLYILLGYFMCSFIYCVSFHFVLFCLPQALLLVVYHFWSPHMSASGWDSGTRRGGRGKRG